jgi:hypothetical protein
MLVFFTLWYDRVYCTQKGGLRLHRLSPFFEPILNNEQDDVALVAGGRGCGRGRNRSRDLGHIISCT